MSITQQQYEKAATNYFTNDHQGKLNFQKYFTSTLLSAVVKEMQSSLPSVVAARLAFQRLVANGLQRTDGRNDQDDLREHKERTKANLDNVIAEIDAPPLSKDELEYFSSLGREQLSALYYGPDGDAICDFAIRYDKAIREHMFRRPERFQKIETPTEQGEVTLSAQEYHALRAADVVRRLRDPRFKILVDRLIQRGEI
jgi:hypothetical protein